MAAGEVHEGLGSWHKNILVAGETVRGRIYTSLVAEVQIEWVRAERIKDIYLRPWLLEKIRSASKELKQKAVVVQTLEWKFKANIARNATFEGRLGPNFCPIWVKNGKKLIIFKNFTLVSLEATKLIVI